MFSIPSQQFKDLKREPTLLHGEVVYDATTPSTALHLGAVTGHKCYCTSII